MLLPPADTAGRISPWASLQAAHLTAAALWLIPLLHALAPSSFSAHDLSRLLQLVLLACTALSALRHKARPLLRLREKLLCHGLLISIAISTLLADDRLSASREISLLCALCLAALVWAREMEQHGWTSVLRLAALGTASYGLLVVGIAVVALLSGAPVAGWEMLIGFDNPRFLNHVQTVSIPLAALVAIQSDSTRFWRAVAGFATFSNGALLFICQGRSIAVALVLGLAAAMLLMRGSERWRYALSLSVPLMLGAIFMAAMWKLAPASVGGVGSDGFATVHSRDFLLLRAWEMFKQSPWFGVGPMHFAHVYNGKAAHPHNVYIQFLAEFGVIATGFAALLAWKGLGRCATCFRSIAADQRPLAVALCTSTVAVLVDALFSGNFVMPVSQLWIAILIALLIAVYRRSQPPREIVATSSPWKVRLNIFIQLVFIVATLALTGISAFEAFTCDPLVLPGADPAVWRYVAPRFWSHGWF